MTCILSRSSTFGSSLLRVGVKIHTCINVIPLLLYLLTDLVVKKGSGLQLNAPLPHWPKVTKMQNLHVVKISSSSFTNAWSHTACSHCFYWFGKIKFGFLFNTGLAGLPFSQDMLSRTWWLVLCVDIVHASPILRVFPQPAKIEITRTATECTPLTSDFELFFDFDASPTIAGADVLRQAMRRYSSLISSMAARGEGIGAGAGLVCQPFLSPLRRLNVALQPKQAAASHRSTSTPLFPALNDDESYDVSLTAGSPNATLTAATVWGALRGLESFSQLIHAPQGSSLVVPASSVLIQDRPRFRHRGLMIDTV